MTYLLLLVVSGFCWFGVAAVLGPAIPIWGAMWPQHLIAAIVTSVLIGVIFRRPIFAWRGPRWYLLPVLTLATAAGLYGLLVPISWWLTDSINGKGGIDGQAFYQLPMFMIFYSLTLYLIVLYPLALLTQTLLRKVRSFQDHERREDTTGTR
jgi:hypothetical protein